jgi:hypothetical protein
VSAYPTIFIIDHKGVIRNKFVGSPGADVLDKTIEGLLKEAADKSKAGT